MAARSAEQLNEFPALPIRAVERREAIAFGYEGKRWTDE
jgi:hypothetical protein